MAQPASSRPFALETNDDEPLSDSLKSLISSNSELREFLERKSAEYAKLQDNHSKILEKFRHLRAELLTLSSIHKTASLTAHYHPDCSVEETNRRQKGVIPVHREGGQDRNASDEEKPYLRRSLLDVKRSARSFEGFEFRRGQFSSEHEQEPHHSKATKNPSKRFLSDQHEGSAPSCADGSDSKKRDLKVPNRLLQESFQNTTSPRFNDKGRLDCETHAVTPRRVGNKMELTCLSSLKRVVSVPRISEIANFNIVAKKGATPDGHNASMSHEPNSISAADRGSQNKLGEPFLSRLPRDRLDNKNFGNSSFKKPQPRTREKRAYENQATFLADAQAQHDEAGKRTNWVRNEHDNSLKDQIAITSHKSGEEVSSQRPIFSALQQKHSLESNKSRLNQSTADESLCQISEATLRHKRHAHLPDKEQGLKRPSGGNRLTELTPQKRVWPSAERGPEAGKSRRKHSFQSPRVPSPPGFWRTDMPSTQEKEEK